MRPKHLAGRPAERMTVDEMVAAALDVLRAPEKHRTVSTVAGTMRVRQDSEKSLWLPNGVRVQVRTDASGVATHIEEDHRLHAIARPEPIAMKTAIPKPTDRGGTR